MEYQKELLLEDEVNLHTLLLKLDDFVQDYWGQSSLYIACRGEIIENSELLSLLQPVSQEIPQTICFFCFKDPQSYIVLKENGYRITPLGSEVFCFYLQTSSLEVRWYNSLETDTRQRQFDRISELVWQSLMTDLPEIRLQEQTKACTAIMYKYRRSEGKVGFHFIPMIENDEQYYPCVFIYWSDFNYLRPFIMTVFPLEWERIEYQQFDDTSQNWIKKEEWLAIIARMQTHMKHTCSEKQQLRTYFNYIIDWLEKQLSWADYIVVDGNL